MSFYIQAHTSYNLIRPHVKMLLAHWTFMLQSVVPFVLLDTFQFFRHYVLLFPTPTTHCQWAVLILYLEFNHRELP